MVLTEPIDAVHADSIVALLIVRQRYTEACRKLGLTPTIQPKETHTP